MLFDRALAAAEHDAEDGVGAALRVLHGVQALGQSRAVDPDVAGRSNITIAQDQRIVDRAIDIRAVGSTAVVELRSSMTFPAAS